MLNKCMVVQEGETNGAPQAKSAEAKEKLSSAPTPTEVATAVKESLTQAIASEPEGSKGLCS